MRRFFKPKLKRNSYGSTIGEDPPSIHTVVRECLQEAVNTHVEQYFRDNPEKVAEVFAKVCVDVLGFAVLKSVDSLFHGQFFNFQIQMQQALEAMRNGG